MNFTNGVHILTYHTITNAISKSKCDKYMNLQTNYRYQPLLAIALSTVALESILDQLDYFPISLRLKTLCSWYKYFFSRSFNFNTSKISQVLKSFILIFLMFSYLVSIITNKDDVFHVSNQDTNFLPTFRVCDS